ncbi:MAG: hypothetical protein HYU28_02795 [Actinobacteria bacterium]|nr:hypothetical protein [Actinomycetota bacterium]
MTKRRHWSRRLVAVAVAVELVGGGAVLYARSLDTTTPVGVDEVVARYRERAGEGVSGERRARLGPRTQALSSDVSVSTQPSVRGPEEVGLAPLDTEPDTHTEEIALPDPGVYVWNTTGYESVTALGGARHDYPAQTTITISHGGCGSKARWDVLEERWDEWENCVTDLGEEWRVFWTHHEFFGQSDDRSYECEPGSVMRPARPEVGMTWKARCVEPDSWFEEQATVVAIETLTIGGEPVDTFHIRMESTAGGDTRGSGVHEYWFATSRNLMVKTAGRFDSESDSPFGAGTVDYHEEYEATLSSLEPLQ